MQVRHDKILVFAARRDQADASHEFLQLRAVTEATTGGNWQSVWGEIHADETAWRAALRELRRKTSLTPLEFYRCERITSFYSATEDTMWHCPQFLSVVDRAADVQISSEYDAFRWVERRHVPTLFLWPAERWTIAEMSLEILDDGPIRPWLRIPMPG